MTESVMFSAKCSSTSNQYQSNWSAWSLANQGSYNEGAPRVGAMLFAALRNEIAWNECEINKISLTLTFNSAGGNKVKTLSIYQGTQTALTGTGQNMIGTAIGNVSTLAKAYDSTLTIEFDADTNAAAFANLVSWLQDTESLILALWRDEASEADTYSANYLQITAATMAIEYTSSPFYVYDEELGFVNAPAYVYTDAGEFVPLTLGNVYTE